MTTSISVLFRFFSVAFYGLIVDVYKRLNRPSKLFSPINLLASITTTFLAVKMSK